MADVMKLEPKRKHVEDLCENAWGKVEELKEFLDLLETKIECEFQRAESLDLLSRFDLNHLKKTPFESICKSIIKKAENEAYQNYELVESLKNVIYEPLKDKVRDYSEKIESLDESFDDHFKKLKQSKEKLIGVDSNYNHYSKQLTEAMKKIEYKSSNRKVDFFDDKLFSSLNSKMKTVDTTAKEVESQTLELNELVAKYKEDMESKIIDLEKMEGDRIQAIVDALNQMNIFQTNCDMNNKYDSNNFNQEVDDIKTDQAVQECKTLYDPAPMIKIESYDFQQYDELITHEDIEMNEIPEQEEQKHREVIQSYVDKIEEDTLDFTKFEELMDMKINRYLFVTIVNKFSKPSLPSMKAHNNLSKLINCCLKGCDKNADSEYLKNLMIVASEIYYDEEEEEDSVIRTYITEGIRKSSIWENSAIWGKAIFKDFRDILMKFKIPKDHQEEVNKDEVLRNVFFNRLQFYVEKLAYFDMEEELLLKIVDKFHSSYKFTKEQYKTLKTIIESRDAIEQDDDFFGEESKRQTSRGSITKRMGSWMNNIGKLSASAMSKMKTYMKKNNTEQEPVVDSYDDCAIEGDDTNTDTNHTSQTHSEASPPKEEGKITKGEIPVEEINESKDKEAQEEIEIVDKEDLKQVESSNEEQNENETHNENENEESENENEESENENEKSENEKANSSPTKEKDSEDSVEDKKNNEEEKSEGSDEPSDASPPALASENAEVIPTEPSTVSEPDSEPVDDKTQVDAK